MRCLQRTQRIQKYNTHPDRVCSPCFSLAKDTEVSSGIQPDYGAASFPWLWDSSVHHKDLILRSRCCTKDSNITVALQFLNPCHLKNGNKYSLCLVTGFTVTPFLSWIFLASSAHISGGRNSDMRRGGKQRSLTNWDIFDRQLGTTARGGVRWAVLCWLDFCFEGYGEPLLRFQSNVSQTTS